MGIMYPGLLFEHNEVEICSCGHKPCISTGSYADEFVSVVCEFCDTSSESYLMGEYEEGIDLAIKDWNNAD